MVKGEHPWYRKRGYLHFDLPVGIKKASAIVLDTEKVSRHAFWPFIDYQIVTEKLSKDADGDLKKKIKERLIAYAAHLDSHIYSYYSNLLSQFYEEELKKRQIGRHVLAFRALGKSNIHFARDAFKAIESFGPCGVIALDVSGFFDNLNHDYLKSRWSELLGKSLLPKDHYNVFKSLTKFSTVNRDALYSRLNIAKHNPKNGRERVCSTKEFDRKVRKEKLIIPNRNNHGIPQGAPISSLLSNIYMLEFDQKMSESVAEWGGHYFRYCDDMLFVVPQEFTNSVAGMVVTELKSLGLTINSSKTEIRTFENIGDGQKSNKPLQYLGFLYDGQSILIRSAAFARFSERMKGGVKLAKSTQVKRNAIRVRRGEKPTRLFKQKLYERYSHLGRRNFIRYGLRAAEIMDSKAIKKQLKPLWKNLQEEIHKSTKK
ncbi:antiviral reverse transcriptase Drt2 [Alcanivorax sp.]|jgi:hypothetical protein|uniref:antiviral reverse transcriptase Drt2 n=1 Tax=Alcanivorax sp. TaxID=1872427 RepID=UPI0025BEADEE|nr:antiviral reverse transcriptase Drt2 [Alcanivorax sp.]